MGLIDRILGRKHEPPPAPDASLRKVEFAVGDRVQDAFGATGTVLVVDPAAEHGLGLIRVKLDDGREIAVACLASGLERLS